MKDMNEICKAITAELEKDEEFFKAFISSENAEALCGVLTARGYGVTVDDVNEMFVRGAKGIVEYMENKDELSQGQLEEVAGGGFLRGTVRLIISGGVAFGYGAFCGICPPAYAGAPYVAGGLAIWTTAGYMKKGW